MNYDNDKKENNVTSFCGQLCRHKKTKEIIVVRCHYWRIVRLFFYCIKFVREGLSTKKCIKNNPYSESSSYKIALVVQK